MNKLTLLINTKKTVFTYEQMQIIFSHLPLLTLKQFLYRAKQQGDLLNPIK
jgi:hypothetical protein